MQADHLQAQGLVKEYHRRRVVDGVDLSVSRGEIVGLLGPNGAGKTTTFYMVAGLIRPDSGRVFLDEEEITHLPMHRRARLGITYLPQEASIFRKLTVSVGAGPNNWWPNLVWNTWPLRKAISFPVEKEDGLRS